MNLSGVEQGLIVVIISAISGVVGYMFKREGRIGDLKEQVGEMKGLLKAVSDTVEEHKDDFKEIKYDLDGIAASLVRQGLSLQKKPKQEFEETDEEEEET